MADDMSFETYSVALTETVNTELTDHLLRSDGQEDLCFALYNPSRGSTRLSALIDEVLLPRPEDREVHGNASFTPEYVERALEAALQNEQGIALLHSHPLASDWQPMSHDDRVAEQGLAGTVYGATDLPLVGLTLSGETGFWSGRVWTSTQPREWKANDCESVRVVGNQLSPYFCPRERKSSNSTKALDRTVHAWGEDFHRTLTRLRLGVVGLGSVGSLVSESLARMGFRDVLLVDFDEIRNVNLDRTTNAYPAHARTGQNKVQVAGAAANRCATNPNFEAKLVTRGIQDEAAYRAALDCDVLFSCVDRPLARSILNFTAYTHLIPVIDGGIHCSRKTEGTLRSADWGTFVVGPSRRCLQCHGQYDPGLVQVEREGLLEDPDYVEALPDDSPFKQRQNVFAFSMALASKEVLKLAHLVGAFSGIPAPGTERYSFPSSMGELENESCSDTCLYPGLTAQGEHGGHPGTE